MIHIPTPVPFAQDDNYEKPLAIESLKKSDPTEFERLKRYYEELANMGYNKCIIKGCAKYKVKDGFCTVHFKEHQAQQEKEKIILTRGEKMEKEIAMTEKTAPKQEAKQEVKEANQDIWLSLASNHISNLTKDFTEKSSARLKSLIYDPVKAAEFYLNTVKFLETLEVKQQ